MPATSEPHNHKRRECMKYVAYNQTKGAYLYLDSTKHWSLTANPNIAHTTSREKLMSITSQIPRMPLDWVFYPCVNGKIIRDAEQITEYERQSVPDDPPKESAICGEWQMTPEYHEVLDAVQKFASVVNKDKAVRLAEAVSECNANIIDMQHLIEFSELDEKDGYEVYLRFRELLRRRRDLKQQLELTNKILDSGVRKLTDGHSFTCQQQTVQKKYTPRGSGEIFSEIPIRNENHVIECPKCH